MKQLLYLLVMGTLLSSCQPADEHTYAEIETDFGNMKVMLYNTTPKHRDNFIKLAKEGFYDGLLFHRVMAGFMVQGGDPDSKNAAPGQMLGQGGPGYQIEAEIGSPHFKGTLAAARTQNPQKLSSGSQFYIVQGQPIDDASLDNIQNQKNIQYNEQQRQLYKEVGGAPFLDNDYTVFGEVVEGLDVIDKMAAVQTDGNNRPLEDVRMKVRILD
ncbi:MAG: peptidyl-prolyl cis-trans isomerase [Saprospiraceae bacterium]|nr:MAG: peptidyl-prolyl cis-trans isomerase [Saprospiraceae bacterium]